MKILYVEDNPRDAELAMRQLLKAAPHFQLEIVTTLGEASARLERLETEPLDLVLTGMRLPDGDGLALLAQIRSRSLPLAVVVITGTGDEETAVAALKAGADDYVTKRKDYLERLPLVLESALHHYRDREKTLRESEERKRHEEAVSFQAHLLNTIEQAVIATDMAGVVIFWNQFAERLYGWSMDEAMGQKVRAINFIGKRPADGGSGSAPCDADFLPSSTLSLPRLHHVIDLSLHRRPRFPSFAPFRQ